MQSPGQHCGASTFFRGHLLPFLAFPRQRRSTLLNFKALALLLSTKFAVLLFFPVTRRETEEIAISPYFLDLSRSALLLYLSFFFLLLNCVIFHGFHVEFRTVDDKTASSVGPFFLIFLLRFFAEFLLVVMLSPFKASVAMSRICAPGTRHCHQSLTWSSKRKLQNLAY